jgi:hypothetical protein
MKLRLLFVAICFAGFSFGQTDTLQQFTLTPDQARSDFRLYRRLLQETHPGLYRYTSKEQMQQFLDSVDALFIQPVAFYDYQRLLALVNAKIRCAHSSALPQDFSGFTGSVKILPLFIHPVQDKYIVIFNGTNDASIQPGWELTQINGRPIDSIAVLKKHFWADGYNEIAKNHVVQGNTFGLFYYLIIERPEKFRLVFKTISGESKEVFIAAQLFQHNNANFKKNPVNKKMMRYYGKGNKSPWELLFPNDVKNTAILKIYGFGGKNQNDGEQARAAMRSFMDKAMKSISNRAITNIILDVRGNPGGWDSQGVELFTYLMKSDSPVYYYKRLHAVTDSSEFLKYSDLSETDRKNVKKELRAEADGTFTMREEYNPDLKLQYPKNNRFEGQLYILVNHRSASTTSEFVAVCKSNSVGTLVGEESGGCYEGGNGASFITMTLPHSKISVSTPLIYYENAVVPVALKGRGMLPDIEVPQTVDDLLIGRDTVMEFVKERIRKKSF